MKGITAWTLGNLFWKTKVRTKCIRGLYLPQILWIGEVFREIQWTNIQLVGLRLLALPRVKRVIGYYRTGINCERGKGGGGLRNDTNQNWNPIHMIAAVWLMIVFADFQAQNMTHQIESIFLTIPVNPPFMVNNRLQCFSAKPRRLMIKEVSAPAAPKNWRMTWSIYLIHITNHRRIGKENTF